MPTIQTGFAEPFTSEVNAIAQSHTLPRPDVVNILIRNGISVLELLEAKRDDYFEAVHDGSQPDPRLEEQLQQVFAVLIKASRKLLDEGHRAFGVDDLPESFRKLREVIERIGDDYPFTTAQRAELPEIGCASGLSKETIREGLEQAERGQWMDRNELFRRARETRQS